MTPTSKAASAGSRTRGRLALLVAFTLWTMATVAIAVLVDWLSETHPKSRLGRWFEAPGSQGLDTIVQVVPAVVIAIFVFAAGTSFVVAQVVPPARGTRAVQLLRARHLGLTIAPALALTPLSALVVVLKPTCAAPLASALLIGSVAYLFVATWCLLGILGEATDPVHYSRLLRSKHDSAMRKLRGPSRRVTQQRAVNAQYDTIRALRGWTRTAATSGDSRELHVSLETTLALLEDYATVKHREKVPRNYEHNAEHDSTNPLQNEHKRRPPPDQDLKPWENWVAPSLPADQAERPVVRKTLADIWVANEVGRSVVRALEFAATSKTLLERDRGRLLASLEKGARRFAKEDDTKSAGVMVAYLIELGLGARRCPPDELLWHFEPLITLAHLHDHFHDPADWARPAVADADHRRHLAVGTAAGVLKVAEAITAARARQHHEQSDPLGWSGSLDTDGDACARTVYELHQVPALGESWRLLRSPEPSQEDPRTSDRHGNWSADGQEQAEEIRSRDISRAVKLAQEEVLEPRDQSLLYRTNTALTVALKELLIEDG